MIFMLMHPGEEKDIYVCIYARMHVRLCIYEESFLPFIHVQFGIQYLQPPQ